MAKAMIVATAVVALAMAEAIKITALARHRR
jgi:hypothetical protein